MRYHDNTSLMISLTDEHNNARVSPDLRCPTVESDYKPIEIPDRLSSIGSSNSSDSDDSQATMAP